MAKISSYPIATPTTSDYVLGCQKSGSGETQVNPTKLFSVKDIQSATGTTVTTLVPFITTASPGGSETYTATNDIVKIGWSGGNGIYIINLPSAAAIPYRVIRFTTNGTYPGGGAHKVRFTPTGVETIDGTAFFEISKAYEGISIWSTGTEWIVIQAKAS